MTVQQEFNQWVVFYNSELSRTGFKPDQYSTRDSRVLFLQQTLQRYCHPHWAMKRGDAGRPISDEVVVWTGHDPEFEVYRTFGDFIISGGGSGWHLSTRLEPHPLPMEQRLVSPLMPLPQGARTVGHLTEPLTEPLTVQGCAGAQTPGPPPGPDPRPVYPPYPQDEAVFDRLGEALFDDYAEANRLRPDDPNTKPNPGMSRWYARAEYDWLTGNVPTIEASIAKHRPGWRAALGLPRL